MFPEVGCLGKTLETWCGTKLESAADPIHTYKNLLIAESQQLHLRSCIDDV